MPNRAPTDGARALYARRKKNMPDCGRTLWVMGFLYTYGYDPRIYQTPPKQPTTPATDIAR